MANLDDRYGMDHRTAAFEQHERGLLVCLAGPGTGKTHSLLARTAALTARGCDPDSICYLTFIKEISKAFIDDYIDRFGQGAYGTSAPRISTLHSFACRVLRNQGFRVGYDGDLYFANVAGADDAGETFLGDLLPMVTRGGCKTVPQLRKQLDVIKKTWRDCVGGCSSRKSVATSIAEFLQMRSQIDHLGRVSEFAAQLTTCTMFDVT